MQFDVIIGNPPYQQSDGGYGRSATPIYHKFVGQAKKLQPRYLTMIIPARWYAGGKGLDEFRDEMLNDRHIKTLVDYESSKNCFDGVSIAGGVCYFLWEKDYQGDCDVINFRAGQRVKVSRALNQFPVLIRANQAVSIVNKVLQRAQETWDKYTFSRNPFGFGTRERGSKHPFPGSVALLSSEGFGYISRDKVLKNRHLIDKYKIIIGQLVPSNGELDVNPSDGYRVITKTRMLKPGEIHTESYLLIGAFDTITEARNFEAFMHLKFSRFLLRQAISSVNVTKQCFRFVPYEDFSKPWTDKELYQKYGLTEEEIAFIESMVRPMPYTINKRLLKEVYNESGDN